MIRYLLFTIFGVIVATTYANWLSEKDESVFKALEERAKERRELICKQFTHHPDCP